MKRSDPAYLVAITDKAETWIRRCGDNKTGYPTDRASLRVVLAASSNVHLDEKGRIAWQADGNSFTAEAVPLPEPTTPSEQWRRNTADRERAGVIDAASSEPTALPA